MKNATIKSFQRVSRRFGQNYAKYTKKKYLGTF